MISILISVFNYDCSALIEALSAQAETVRADMGEDYEIIVGDDASTDKELLEANRRACRRQHCMLVENHPNLGRARNRNSMAQRAAGDKLLFMDCDAEMKRDDFLARYVAALNGNDVVCGGLEAPAKLPSADVKLRYKYERASKKVRSLSYRKANPYLHFAAFCFMIRRELFMSIMFDENCHEYGYEDALFGLRLKQRGIHIEHIDNPMIHVGMDTNEAFVDKSEQAMRTLRGLGPDIKADSHVGGMAMKIKRMRLLWMIKLWHRMFGGLERRVLLGSHPSLFVLKIYKLGYFCQIGGVDKE